MNLRTHLSCFKEVGYLQDQSAKIWRLEIKMQKKNSNLPQKWPARPWSEYKRTYCLNGPWRAQTRMLAILIGVFCTIFLCLDLPFFPHALGAGIVSFLVSYLALNFHLDTYSTIMSIHKQLVKRDGISTTWYKNGQKKAEENCKNGKLISVMVWKPNGQRCPETNVNKGTGVLIEYDENGQKMNETKYEDGEGIEKKAPTLNLSATNQISQLAFI